MAFKNKIVGDTDKCFVCFSPFRENGGTLNCEIHHIIPRAFGGTKGPVVYLCENHHTLIHEVAKKLVKSKPIKNLLQNEKVGLRKIIYLAQSIAKAEVAFGEDENKHLLLALRVSKTVMQVLDKYRGKLSRQEFVLSSVIERLKRVHESKQT